MILQNLQPNQLDLPGNPLYYTPSPWSYARLVFVMCDDAAGASVLIVVNLKTGELSVGGEKQACRSFRHKLHEALARSRARTATVFCLARVFI